MYSHNKGNFFCSSPFAHPFCCCLWNSFQVSSEVESSVLLLPGIPACCCMPPPKYYEPFSLYTNWKCLAPQEKKKKAWKKPKHTFFRLQLFFLSACTVSLYRQCDLQSWGRCGLCSRQVWAGWQLQVKQCHCPSSTPLPCAPWQLFTVATQADAPKQSYHSSQPNTLIHSVRNFPKYCWMKIIP